MANELCSHLGEIDDAIAPLSKGCSECEKVGDTWVHLRLCLSCGNVGCCDESKNTHATKHHRATRHPIIRSHERGEKWIWCFVDKVGFES